MEVALRVRILNSTSADERVDWGFRAQAKQLPAIRLTMVSMPRDYTMAGAQATQMYRVQADCYGSTYKQAKLLGDELTALLEPASGAFQASFVLGQRDNPEQTDSGTVHCRSIDFQITHISG
jgi:hypothetical protein